LKQPAPRHNGNGGRRPAGTRDARSGDAQRENSRNGQRRNNNPRREQRDSRREDVAREQAQPARQNDTAAPPQQKKPKPQQPRKPKPIRQPVVTEVTPVAATPVAAPQSAEQLVASPVNIPSVDKRVANAGAKLPPPATAAGRPPIPDPESGEPRPVAAVAQDTPVSVVPTADHHTPTATPQSTKNTPLPVSASEHTSVTQVSAAQPATPEADTVQANDLPAECGGQTPSNTEDEPGNPARRRRGRRGGRRRRRGSETAQAAVIEFTDEDADWAAADEGIQSVHTQPEFDFDSLPDSAINVSPPVQVASPAAVVEVGQSVVVEEVR